MKSYMLHWFLVVNIFWSPCKVVYWGILKSLQKKKMHPEKNCFLKKCKLSHLKYQTTQRSVQNCRQYRLENKIEVQCKRVKKKIFKKVK